MDEKKLWWRRLNLGRSKLKASARASALLSGFAMVALVEIQIDRNNEVPTALMVAFVICTTLLIAVHMLALMIATCILPHIESIAIIPGTQDFSSNDGSHDRMKNYIEISWFFSTTLGIFLFLVEICLICWVKFWRYGADAVLVTAPPGAASAPNAVISSGSNTGLIASISVTITLIPIMIIFVMFAVTFYKNLVNHQFERSQHAILELDTLISQLNSQGGDLETLGPHVPLSLSSALPVLQTNDETTVCSASSTNDAASLDKANASTVSTAASAAAISAANLSTPEDGRAHAGQH